MTGSNTFQIFPRTKIDGQTIENITPDDKYNNICIDQCRCMCETNNSCIAFTVNEKGENCRLKSTYYNTTPDLFSQTYIKGARSNYYLIWILLFTFILVIFFGSSMYFNINTNTSFYTEQFFPE